MQSIPIIDFFMSDVDATIYDVVKIRLGVVGNNTRWSGEGH